MSQKYSGSILGSRIQRWLCPDVAHRSLWLGLDKLRRFQKLVYHVSQKCIGSILGSWIHCRLCPYGVQHSLWLGLDEHNPRRFQKLVYHASQKYSWSILGSWIQRWLSPDVAHHSLWLCLDKVRRFQKSGVSCVTKVQQVHIGQLDPPLAVSRCGPPLSVAWS